MKKALFLSTIVGPLSGRITAALVVWLAAWAALHWPPSAWAHGDLHERIGALSARIAREPADAALYVKRGRLHHAHRDWAAALGDFGRAADLDPTLTAVEFHRGVTLLDAGQPGSARVALDRFLANHPDDVAALVARGRALASLGDPLAAAEDFTRAIARLPRPEYYLERARALMVAGDVYLDEALRGLDAGLAALGPLASLQLLAIELELQQDRFEAALARLDALAPTTARQETWLARRAEILERSGRLGEARTAITAALEALETLPSHRRHTQAMHELDGRLRAALERLRAAPPGDLIRLEEARPYE